MKTSLLIFAITAFISLLFNCQSVHAQPAEVLNDDKGIKFGIGGGGGITNNKSTFGYGLGIDLRLQWDLSNYVSVMGTGGYTRLYGKNLAADYDFVPAKGGVKVFPIENIYGLGEIGAGFGIHSSSKTALVWSAGIGYDFKSGLDLGIRYESYRQDSSSSTYVPVTGQYAFRLAYGFKL